MGIGYGSTQGFGSLSYMYVPATSSWEALEGASGISPLDLRLTEISIREVAKMNAKSIDHPLKLQLNQCMEEEPDRKFIDPLDLALCQATDAAKY